MYIFTARKVTQDRVYEDAICLPFPINGQCTNDNAQCFTLGVACLLRSTYNPDSGSNGMAPLLWSSTDEHNQSHISGLTSTLTITATAILLHAVKDANNANRASLKPDLPIKPTFSTSSQEPRRVYQNMCQKRHTKSTSKYNLIK